MGDPIMALIDAPRGVVCVHGVQSQRNCELKGYFRPTQDLTWISSWPPRN